MPSLTNAQTKELYALVRNVKVAVAELDSFLETGVEQERRRLLRAARAKGTTNYPPQLAAEAVKLLRTILKSDSIDRRELFRYIRWRGPENLSPEIETILHDERWQDEQKWLDISPNGRLTAVALATRPKSQRLRTPRGGRQPQTEDEK